MLANELDGGADDDAPLENALEADGGADDDAAFELNAPAELVTPAGNGTALENDDAAIVLLTPRDVNPAEDG